MPLPSVPPELTVGYPEIDEQHRGLVSGADAAVEAARAGDLAAARAAMARLGAEFVAHFAAEEALMASASYPELPRHRSAHDLFMHDFLGLSRQLEDDGLTPAAADGITRRMPEWMRFHIRVNDVPLGRYLSARGFRTDVAPGGLKPRAS